MRLHNIKSFGEGPCGDGVTVAFQPGVNRIAGRNGNGKTTLIESLGFALFGACPLFLETFDPTTYFLRSGCRAGEIEVTFTHGEGTWRVERPLGKGNPKRAKVAQVEDGSLCAEGEAEVTAFLCRLLGVAEPRRLQDLFTKLLGVQQGHLTRPFDSKPGQAKEFFEPLLEVEIFRQCFERLKPALDPLDQRRRELERERAALEERIRERQDSAEALQACRAALEELERDAQALEKELEAVRTRKAALEGRAAAIREAQGLRDQARQTLALRRQDLAHAQELAGEAREAARDLAALEEGHRSFLEAEGALAQLRVHQKTRQDLEGRRQAAALRKAEREAQGRLARDRAALHRGQGDQKQQEAGALEARRTALAAELETSREAFQALQEASREGAEALEGLTPFLSPLPRHLERQARLLEQVEALQAEMAGWDPQAPGLAREEEARQEKRVQDLAAASGDLEARHRALAAQLKDIKGGVCPFLKEACRQFDPARVGADLEALAARIPEAARALLEAREALAQARARREELGRKEAQRAARAQVLREAAQELGASFQALEAADLWEALGRLQAWGQPSTLPAFPGPGEDRARHGAILSWVEQLRGWWRERAALAREAKEEADGEALARLKKEQECQDLGARRALLAREAGDLEAQAHGQATEAQTLEAQAREAQGEVEALQGELLAFAHLDEDLAFHQRRLEAHRETHEAYLGRKPAADQLQSREQELERQLGLAAGAAAALEDREKELEALQMAFDPQALQQAADRHQALVADDARHQTRLDGLRRDLELARRRHEEWNQAREAHGLLQARHARLEAARDLGELAREVLKNAAPAVAQHLCTAIAREAQRLFNRINGDPVELQWSSQRYSLRVDPGERRFAMLSGGEQTKLALAMTLAMVQEFSALRFCIFDEPTYGVDAESRARLADAILDKYRLSCRMSL
jgi:exonuclease SbcC